MLSLFLSYECRNIISVLYFSFDFHYPWPSGHSVAKCISACIAATLNDAKMASENPVGFQKSGEDGKSLCRLQR